MFRVDIESDNGYLLLDTLNPPPSCEFKVGDIVQHRASRKWGIVRKVAHECMDLDIVQLVTVEFFVDSNWGQVGWIEFLPYALELRKLGQQSS